MNLNLLFDNADLKDLRVQQKLLVKLLLIDGLTLQDTAIEECINTIDLLGHRLGLQYGHSTNLRKCASSFLGGTKYKLNLINLKFAYINLCLLAVKIKEVISEGKNIYVCTNSTVTSEYKNLVLTSRWIPGSITNRKYVGQKERVKFHLIISTNVTAYAIISREVCIYNESAESKIHFASIIDTNVNTTDCTINHRLIAINHDNPFFSRIISGFIEMCINYKEIEKYDYCQTTPTQPSSPEVN